MAISKRNHYSQIEWIVKDQYIISCCYVQMLWKYINFRSATNTHPRRVAIFFVRFDFYQKNNQTGFKKKKIKTSSNRPVSVWFGDFRTKTSSNQFFGLARFFSVWVRFFRFQAYKTETKPVNFLKIIISFFSQFGFFSYFFSSFLDLIDFYTN